MVKALELPAVFSVDQLQKIASMLMFTFAEEVLQGKASEIVESDCEPRLEEAG